jgi:hypothetical protein
MKKLLTICLLMAMVFTVNAQDKKPTKEETISWLKEKLGNYLEGDYCNPTIIWNKYEVQNFDINECEILIKLKYTTNNLRGYTEYYDMTIPTKNMEFNQLGHAETNIKAIKKILTKTTKSEFEDNIGKVYFSDNTKCQIKVRFDREENLQSRINTALKYLASFCPEKKKETF